MDNSIISKNIKTIRRDKMMQIDWSNSSYIVYLWARP